MPRKLTDQERADRAMIEAAFQRRVLYRARKHGWRCVHFHQAAVGVDGEGNAIIATPVSGDAKGFPDLILVKPGRPVIFAELKRELGHLSAEQEAWMDLLAAAGQCVVIWRPSMLRDIEKVLRG